MLDNFFISLFERKTTDTVCNQYKNKHILNNLKMYFSYLFKKRSNILFIGEAPGYRGCGVTGIPFTSGQVINCCNNRLFESIRSELTLDAEISENTATIMWNTISDSFVPLLWNAFPFHPHKPGNIMSNRKPNAVEIGEGMHYLKIVHDVFKPQKLCAIGRVGERVLKKIYTDRDITYIRHPSYGGKATFVNQMQNIINSFEQ